MITSRFWLYAKAPSAELVDCQLQALRAFVKEKGTAVASESLDIGQHLALNRPGLQGAVRAIADKQASSILVLRFSVISRSADQLFQVLHEIEGHGGSLVSVAEYGMDLRLQEIIRTQLMARHLPPPIGFPDKRIVDGIRQKYPKGTRVRLIHMDDPQAPPPGTLGTVVGVDDVGSIMVHWDNGSSLHVVYGADSCQRTGEAKPSEINP